MELVFILCVFLFIFVYLRIKKQEMFLNLEQTMLESKLASEIEKEGSVEINELNSEVENNVIQNYLKKEGLKKLYQNQELNTPVDKNTLMADEFLIEKLEDENINQLDTNILTLQNIQEQLKTIEKSSLPLPMLDSQYE